jgi:hypothetical protein
VTERIAQAFRDFREVNTTLAMIGRAEKGETADANHMEIYTEQVAGISGRSAEATGSASLPDTRCRIREHFTTLSTIENAPYRKVLHEVLVSVFDSCSHEQQVTRFKRISLAVVEENTMTANNEVDLVLRVGRLFVRRDGTCKFHVARAALQN